MLRLRNPWSVDDKACLWSWFSSVQAATHNEREDRNALERKVDRPLHSLPAVAGAMLKCKTAKPLTMSSTSLPLAPTARHH
jgi:hypothetical protein